VLGESEAMKEKENQDIRRMKIAQLCRESGFQSSAIHRYLKMGILHEPQKAGLNVHLYDEAHLNKLKKLRRLREQENLPLSTIKEILNQKDVPADPASLQAEDVSAKKRLQIVDKALELFSQKGYDGTTVSNITDALRMSKGTFYLYFKDKRELLIECIEQFAFKIVPQETWDGIRNEKDFFNRSYLRALAFEKSFPNFRGILNLLRLAMAGDDEQLARKAREGYKRLVSPLLKEYRRAVSAGIVRAFDEELLAYLGLAGVEALGYWLMLDSNRKLEDGVKAVLDIIINGYRNRGTGKETHSESPLAEVTDSSGVTTRLRGIHFNDRPHVAGWLGDAEIQLDPGKLEFITFVGDDGRFLGTIQTKDGKVSRLVFDREIEVSGDTSFGKFRIPIGKLNCIHFCLDDKEEKR
jgi:AcrR family transcriptional regulator